MTHASFLAVDWGTTNRRVFRVENGKAVATERDDHGVRAIAPGAFEAEAAGIRTRMGELPMLMAGMVGSNIGWREVPYVAAPAGFATLVAGLARIDDRSFIVPGVAAPADVMRGEEVQLLGAVESGMAPPDALLAQPGTHCKWAEMRGGAIAGFTTAMTGELFALLREHSLLAPQLAGEVAPGPAFADGVREGSRRDIAASLFGLRAAHLLRLREDADAAAYASGVLIGADVAARLDGRGDKAAWVLADPGLGGLYIAAIGQLGGAGHLVDSHEAFMAGIVRIAKDIL